MLSVKSTEKLAELATLAVDFFFVFPVVFLFFFGLAASMISFVASSSVVNSCRLASKWSRTKSYIAQASSDIGLSGPLNLIAFFFISSKSLSMFSVVRYSYLNGKQTRSVRQGNFFHRQPVLCDQHTLISFREWLKDQSGD